MTFDALLSVEKVSKSFGGLVVLDDVSLMVRPGEIKAVIGPNGAGKTTLFNVISGVLRPERGHIQFEGRDIVNLRPDQVCLAGITRTFQQVNLFGDMTVLENVLVGYHSRMQAGLLASLFHLPPYPDDERRARAQAEDLLDLLGLNALSGLRAATLSFGQRRWLELARALAAQPRLLLLDEAASGLNPTEVHEFAALVRRLREEKGITFLIVEHNLNLVMRLADSVTVLNFGRVIADGTPSEIKNQPEVVAAYLGRRGSGHAQN